MELTPEQRKNLRKALISAFPRQPELGLMLEDELGVELNQITEGEANYELAVRVLVKWAESQGRLTDLVVGACRSNPGNPALKNFRDSLPHLKEDWSLRVPYSQVIEGAYPSTIVVREIDSELNEDPRSAHLVIAVFWQKRSEQKLRVQPKLCYRNAETPEMLQESLVKDDCPPIALKDFPSFLKGLVSFTIGKKLSRLFADPIYPWKLTIELFVPLDLLPSPLTKWCGQDGELLRNRSIVVGCSDRFDPDQPERAADLHNQLKRGWQRFQEKVPDRVGSMLQNLNWLNSDVAHQENFEIYSGFRCYGEWLKPDEQCLENWQRLIQSGIPLALWMCEGQAQREAIESAFTRLVDGTRFEFLDRIPMIRDEQQRTCNHCVGVFYEDPHYVPEVPRPREDQFFAWPGT